MSSLLSRVSRQVFRQLYLGGLTTLSVLIQTNEWEDKKLRNLLSHIPQLVHQFERLDYLEQQMQNGSQKKWAERQREYQSASETLHREFILTLYNLVTYFIERDPSQRAPERESTHLLARANRWGAIYSDLTSIRTMLGSRTQFATDWLLYSTRVNRLLGYVARMAAMGPLALMSSISDRERQHWLDEYRNALVEEEMAIYNDVVKWAATHLDDADSNSSLLPAKVVSYLVEKFEKECQVAVPGWARNPEAEMPMVKINLLSPTACGEHAHSPIDLDGNDSLLHCIRAMLEEMQLPASAQPTIATRLLAKNPQDPASMGSTVKREDFHSVYLLHFHCEVLGHLTLCVMPKDLVLLPEHHRHVGIFVRQPVRSSQPMMSAPAG